jgi:hypothetical protein
LESTKDRPWEDLRTGAKKQAELRSRWIDQKLASLIEACSATVETDRGTEFKPNRPDLERVICKLLEAQPDRPGPGRPRSPRVNGVRLRALRAEAGMSQAAVVEDCKTHLGMAGAFNLKTLRRYEHSEPGDMSNLAAVAAVLTARLLPRVVTVQEITLQD